MGNDTKNRIVKYIMDNQTASKVQLSKQLNLSMPTIISNVNELVEKKILIEVGEYESTGGRRAKSLGICRTYCYSVGINITANHIGIVLLNLAGEIVKQQRLRNKFAPDLTYFEELKKILDTFLRDTVSWEKVIGIGVSLPGIINQRERVLVKSHALSLENFSLRMMEQMMPLPVYFENDANAAMMAENYQKYQNVIYLSLNNTLGGAVCIDGKLFRGQYQKAGEFGHMIIVPDGRTCYCGKKGCSDAYCAASVLTENNKISLDDFFRRLKEGDKNTLSIWGEYLDKLAILITNLRMAFDSDIILGGDVGGVMTQYKMEVGKKIMDYNRFDGDLSYLMDCSYRKEASAVGVAKYFLNTFAEQIS